MNKIIDIVEKKFFKYQSKILKPFILSKKKLSEGKSFNPNPKVSAIIQVFNKKGFIRNILKTLIQLPIDEIILIDDGSIDGTLKDAIKILTGKNHFILRTNDIFEVRSYQRALQLTTSEFVVLLQDDDFIPTDPSWVENAIKLFKKDSKLLILGGREGLNIFLPKSKASGQPNTYKKIENRTSIHGVLEYDVIYKCNFTIQSIPFQYTMAINRAPMWVRRKPFLASGGIDQLFAPFQCDDVDACIRSWNQGWRVGLYKSGFKSQGLSGMNLFNQEKTKRYSKEHWKIIYDRYSSQLKNTSLRSKINKANKNLEKLMK